MDRGPHPLKVFRELGPRPFGREVRAKSVFLDLCDQRVLVDAAFFTREVHFAAVGLEEFLQVKAFELLASRAEVHFLVPEIRQIVDVEEIAHGIHRGEA